VGKADRAGTDSYNLAARQRRRADQASHPRCLRLRGRRRQVPRSEPEMAGARVASSHIDQRVYGVLEQK
jgi:hypothetical protein